MQMVGLVGIPWWDEAKVMVMMMFQHSLPEEIQMKVSEILLLDFLKYENCSLMIDGVAGLSVACYFVEAWNIIGLYDST